ncbi:hypothetical protein [Sorangium atrum]|uniref:Lipoprotein n=1 Tax=Sorangium atrum TaxID=2995308 RepID=A0ABT5C8S1_9BACT|nr:hypothetical protein [Sorangium aterium]MDC0682790.1 hypothetical protein [Sorangium aterium]
MSSEAADAVAEGEPGGDSGGAMRANAEHGPPPRMCEMGAVGPGGVCLGAAVAPGGRSASAAGLDDGERAERACRQRSFSRQYPGKGATLRGFTIDGAGRALLAGSFEGELTFGSTRLRSAGATDAFVAELDACGAPLWSEQFGDGTAQSAIDVAASSGGQTLVLGDFAGTVRFGAHRLTAASPSGADLFLAKLGPRGAASWAAQISAEEGAILSGTALAADGRGGALVLGRLEGAAKVAGARIERRAIGAFVVRLDASGRFAWVSLPPSGSDSDEIGIKVDRDGNAILASQDGRGTATFVTKLDRNGELVWHKRFRGSPDQLEEAYDLAVDPEGAALLSGSGVFGEPDLPGGPRPFVAKIGPDGRVIWVKRFDARSPRRVTASGERVVLAGDALCGSAGEPASCSAWAAGLSSSGEEQWTRRIGADVHVSGLEMDPWESPMLAGSFHGTMALGGERLSSDQGALFLTRLPDPG